MPITSATASRKIRSTANQESSHWRGSVPFAETVEACEDLKRAGKIRHWGVSNLDLDDMNELRSVEAGANCATNQVLYHLGERGIEWALLPDCQNHAMPVMAYSPLGQGAILKHPTLAAIAARHGVTPAAIALAWVLRQPGVIAIPKAATRAHVDANAGALGVTLQPEDLAALDTSFRPPSRKVPLAIL